MRAGGGSFEDRRRENIQNWDWSFSHFKYLIYIQVKAPQLPGTSSERLQGGQLQCLSHHWNAQWRCFLQPRQAIPSKYFPYYFWIWCSAQTTHHLVILPTSASPPPSLHLFPISWGCLGSQQQKRGPHEWQQYHRSQQLLSSSSEKYWLSVTQKICLGIKKRVV